MYEAKLAHVQPDTIPARPPEGRVIRRFLFNVAMDARWRVAVGCLIGANVVVRFLMGTVSSNYRDAPFWVHAHEVRNYVKFVTCMAFWRDQAQWKLVVR